MQHRTYPQRLTETIWQSWPVYLARYYVRQTYDDLPGPWPVKIALVAVCVAIPGPQDELLLIAFTRVCRVRRERQAAR